MWICEYDLMLILFFFLFIIIDKTIKLWKIFEKKIKTVTTWNSDKEKEPKTSKDLIIPSLVCFWTLLEKMIQKKWNRIYIVLFLFFYISFFEKQESKENVVAASTRRVFANAHAYHINSISLNSDCETYISSDDLRINLWNLSISDQSFNIVDIKPANMEVKTLKWNLKNY